MQLVSMFEPDTACRSLVRQKCALLDTVYNSTVLRTTVVVLRYALFSALLFAASLAVLYAKLRPFRDMLQDSHTFAVDWLVLHIY